ncbi:MAG: hypothetical protein M1836_004556 [Candelina mexicana]|nr:MAG: hypothetical protein M1836_004556 [Candelina mexicana]
MSGGANDLTWDPSQGIQFARSTTTQATFAINAKPSKVGKRASAIPRSTQTRPTPQYKPSLRKLPPAFPIGDYKARSARKVMLFDDSEVVEMPSRVPDRFALRSLADAKATPKGEQLLTQKAMRRSQSNLVVQIKVSEFQVKSNLSGENRGQVANDTPQEQVNSLLRGAKQTAKAGQLQARTETKQRKRLALTKARSNRSASSPEVQRSSEMKSASAAINQESTYDSRHSDPMHLGENSHESAWSGMEDPEDVLHDLSRIISHPETKSISATKREVEEVRLKKQVPEPQLQRGTQHLGADASVPNEVTSAALLTFTDEYTASRFRSDAVFKDISEFSNELKKVGKEIDSINRLLNKMYPDGLEEWVDDLKSKLHRWRAVLRIRLLMKRNPACWRYRARRAMLTEPFSAWRSSPFRYSHRQELGNIITNLTNKLAINRNLTPLARRLRIERLGEMDSSCRELVLNIANGLEGAEEYRTVFQEDILHGCDSLLEAERKWRMQPFWSYYRTVHAVTRRYNELRKSSSESGPGLSGLYTTYRLYKNLNRDIDDCKVELEECVWESLTEQYQNAMKRGVELRPTKAREARRAGVNFRASDTIYPRQDVPLVSKLPSSQWGLTSKSSKVFKEVRSIFPANRPDEEPTAKGQATTGGQNTWIQAEPQSTGVASSSSRVQGDTGSVDLEVAEDAKSAAITSLQNKKADKEVPRQRARKPNSVIPDCSRGVAYPDEWKQRGTDTSHGEDALASVNIIFEEDGADAKGNVAGESATSKTRQAVVPKATTGDSNHFTPATSKPAYAEDCPPYCRICERKFRSGNRLHEHIRAGCRAINIVKAIPQVAPETKEVPKAGLVSEDDHQRVRPAIRVSAIERSAEKKIQSKAHSMKPMDFRRPGKIATDKQRSYRHDEPRIIITKVECDVKEGRAPKQLKSPLADSQSSQPHLSIRRYLCGPEGVNQPGSHWYASRHKEENGEQETKRADLIAHESVGTPSSTFKPTQPLNSTVLTGTFPAPTGGHGIPEAHYDMKMWQTGQSPDQAPELGLDGDNQEPVVAIGEDPLPHRQPLYQIPEAIKREKMLASLSTGAAYWSFDLYRGPAGEKIKVHYCKSRETTERVSRHFLNQTVLGFDIEWKPQAAIKDGIKQNVSLIQLACEDRIALFHVARYQNCESVDDFVAPTLKRIMESPEITKVGVAVKGDCTRLKKFLEIDSQGTFELSHLHTLLRFSSGDQRHINKKLVALARQVEEHLQLPLYKGEVRSSDWSKELKMQQILYAASDSYAGLQLFHVMEGKRKALDPTPPRPAHTELNLPIRLADGVVVSTSDEQQEVNEDVTDDDGKPSDVETMARDVLNLAIEDNTKPTTTPPTDPANQSKPTPTPKPPKAPQIILAEDWVSSWRSSRPQHHKPRATPAYLRAYALWHEQNLPVADIAALLRDPPLQKSTVATYILEAIRLERFEYGKDRIGDVLDHIPVTFRQGKYSYIERD